MRRITSLPTLLLAPLLALALLLPWWAAAWAQIPSSVVTTPQVRAELVAHAPEGIGPGRPLALGLLIDHQPHWHTYWKNPGDSGLPTLLTWDLPPGVQAGEIAWPTPSKLPLGPLMNFGFEGRLLLPVEVTLPPDFAADALDVRLRAEWLVCKDVCIPEDGEFVLRLPAQAATVGHAAVFSAAEQAMPAPLPDATGEGAVADGVLRLRVTGLPAAWQGREVGFFPETTGVIQNAAVPQARWDGAAWTADVPLDPQRSASPATMPAVFTTPGEPAGVQLTLAVAGPWPAIGAPVAAAVPGPLPAAAPAGAVAGSGLGLPLALLFALLGGMLLNLMPCVFPVL